MKISPTVSAELYERIFADHESRDVEIEMSDGKLTAHSLVLCASSDALKGILKRGNQAASVQKHLSWPEYPVVVGRVFLRLLYTGTVDETDWSSVTATTSAVESSSSEGQSVPLEVLLGAANLAKMYLVADLLALLTKALVERINYQSFDTITAFAIRNDLSALRLRCVQFARDENDNYPERLSWKGGDAHHIGMAGTGNGLVGFNRIDADGTDRFAMLTRFDVDNEIKFEINGTVFRGTVTRREENEHGEIAFGTTASFPENVHRGSFKLHLELRQDRIRKLFDKGELSPPVEAELAEIWGYPRPSKKRQRREF